MHLQLAPTCSFTPYVIMLLLRQLCASDAWEYPSLLARGVSTNIVMTTSGFADDSPYPYLKRNFSSVYAADVVLCSVTWCRFMSKFHLDSRCEPKSMVEAYILGFSLISQMVVLSICVPRQGNMQRRQIGQAPQEAYLFNWLMALQEDCTVVPRKLVKAAALAAVDCCLFGTVQWQKTWGGRPRYCNLGFCGAPLRHEPEW